MAVDRIPAGVADSAGEPAAINSGGGIEHAGGGLEPIDILRGLRPEAFGIALPARIDVVVAAAAGFHEALRSGWPKESVIPAPAFGKCGGGPPCAITTGAVGTAAL